MWFVNFGYPLKRVDQLVLLNLPLRTMSGIYIRKALSAKGGSLRDSYWAVTLTNGDGKGFILELYLEREIIFKHTCQLFSSKVNSQTHEAQDRFERIITQALRRKAKATLPLLLQQCFLMDCYRYQTTPPESETGTASHNVLLPVVKRLLPSAETAKLCGIN